MTPPARFEIQITAERSSPVVAGRAGIIGRRKVLLSARRTDLPPLRETCGVVVTARTFEPLSRRVFGVAETNSIGCGISGRTRISLGCVAHAARCQIASISRRVRSVAGVAAIVRAHSRGNRQGRAASQRSTVTTHASVLRPGAASHMLRMIEPHVEAFFEFVRESFARRIVAVDALMTDRAHRQRRCGELCEVATGASLVSGETGTRRVVSAAMTFVAADRRVFGTRVQKFRVVLIVALRVDGS